MSNDSSKPRGFTEWLTILQMQQIGQWFDETVAAWMRVSANSRENGIFFVSGHECIPYIDWLADGMSMNNRLILHLAAPRQSDFDALLSQHIRADIRQAVHYQELDAFLDDISHHHLDHVMVDLKEVALPMILKMVPMLSANGFLVTLGTPALQQAVVDEMKGKYFFVSISHHEEHQCIIFTRKAPQHLTVRRGGRRRHAKTELSEV